MEKALQDYMLGVGELLSGIAQSEQTRNRDNLCSATFQIFKRATRSGTRINHVIHDSDVRAFDNRPESVWKAIPRRKKVVRTVLSKALRIREGEIEFRGYDQGDKSPFHERTTNRVELERPQDSLMRYIRAEFGLGCGTTIPDRAKDPHGDQIPAENRLFELSIDAAHHPA
jgi:hypothetical protein